MSDLQQSPVQHCKRGFWHAMKTLMARNRIVMRGQADDAALFSLLPGEVPRLCGNFAHQAT